MTGQKTERLPATEEGVLRAALLLAKGRLVAFPTETVYGLGADARDDAAVAAIFAAKGRPGYNPLIVHVADIAAARQIASFSDTAERLAASFWPGPLTLVLPLKPDAGLSGKVTAGLPTVAVRVPANDLAQRLLAAFGGQVAAPSANPSGKVSPTTAEHVLAGLAGRIAAVLDGGACEIGVESTIVGLDPEPVLLRPGGLPAEDIERCLGRILRGLDGARLPNAPGQLASHYAPAAALRLNATEAREGEAMLGFGDVAGDMTLSASGDLHQAAGCLFDRLRALDATGVHAIAVAPVPDHGLGRAINDRLARAAAPRE